MASRLRSYAPVLLLALVLRVFGIATESVWVDEAFSAQASRGSVATILETNARDTHPPAYYLGLSMWRRMFPGADAEPTALAVVLRSYSVLFSLLGVFLAMELARAMAGIETARLAGLFVALSPLDIYFADEARMYAQASALSLGGALALWHWCEAARAGAGAPRIVKPALAFALCGAGLLFTHYVGITLLIGQGLLALCVFARRRAGSSVVALGAAAATVALLFWPWLAYVLGFRGSIVRVAGLDWIPVPGFWDFVSPIGREFFWGRVHRIHAHWWVPTALLPLAIFAAAAWRSLRGRKPHLSPPVVHLLGCFVLPLLVSAVVSSSYQVIYYRPRYSVFLVPYFSIGLAMACRGLASGGRAALAAASVCGLMLLGVAFQQWTPQKRAWRETVEAWPHVDPPAFYVVLPAQHQRPLAYYLGGHLRHTPRAVLERLAPLPEGALIWVATWPEPLSPEDASYRDWLKRQGDARRQTLPTHYTLTQVEPHGEVVWPEFARARFRAWYRPFDIRGEIAGFSESAHFGPIFFDDEGLPVRRGEAHGLLRFDRVEGGETIVVGASPVSDASLPDLHVVRSADAGALVRDGRSVRFDAAAGEYRVPVPPGDAPLWIGWSQPQTPSGGWLVHWVGIAKDRASGMAFRD